MTMPATLVQIHYHMRRGGVQRVMRDYAAAFSRVNPEGVSAFVTAPSCDGPAPDTVLWMTYPDFEYRDFSTADELRSAARSVQKIISDLFNNPALPHPMLVMVHNGNLAKNIAVSAAVYRSALLCESLSDISFVNVVHDCAEEGRPDRMGQIVRFEEMGLPARNWIWPPIPHLVVNRRNERILAAAGFLSRWLPNRLELPVAYSAADRDRISQAFASVLAHDKISCPVNAALYLYPVRVIRRKNPVEAVLVATIVKKGVLILGGAGTSASDRALYASLQELTVRLRLPVLFDADRVIADAGMSPNRGLAPLYAIVDAVLTTATAEGFGYGVYEPWLSGRTVFGRMPHGIEEDRLVDFSHLYSALPLPANRHFPHHAGHDFATIPLCDQYALLEAAATDSVFAQALELAWITRLQTASAVDENARVLKEQLCGDSWDARFATVLENLPAGSTGDPMKITACFNVAAWPLPEGIFGAP